MYYILWESINLELASQYVVSKCQISIFLALTYINLTDSEDDLYMKGYSFVLHICACPTYTSCQSSCSARWRTARSAQTADLDCGRPSPLPWTCCECLCWGCWHSGGSSGPLCCGSPHHGGPCTLTTPAFCLWSGASSCSGFKVSSGRIPTREKINFHLHSSDTSHAVALSEWLPYSQVSDQRRGLGSHIPVSANRWSGENTILSKEVKSKHDLQHLSTPKRHCNHCKLHRAQNTSRTKLWMKHTNPDKIGAQKVSSWQNSPLQVFPWFIGMSSSCFIF